MTFTRNFLTGIFVLFIFILGCSSNNSSLTTPSNDPADQSYSFESDTNGHELAGLWSIKFDPESLEATIIPHRHPDAWIKVNQYLTPSINVNGVTDRVWDIDITINNPYPVSGYDLRGILFTDDYGNWLRNPDSWTALFDIPGGVFLNPFKAYAKEVFSREFAPFSEHTENYQIFFPAGPYLVEFGIIVSSPTNCSEPYSVENFTQEILSDEIGSEALISLDVLDWQDDVTSVNITAPHITGTPSERFTLDAGNTWSLTLVNATGIPPGIYSSIVSAVSDDYPLFDFIDIEITAAD